MDRDKRSKYIGKIFIIMGIFFCIPFLLLLLFPSGSSSEPGFTTLIVSAFLFAGPGFLVLGVIFQIIGKYLKYKKDILALIHYCPDCNFKSLAKEPEFIVCSSCNRLMELGVQCKKCLNWFYTSQLGRTQCPQCKSVVIL